MPRYCSGLLCLFLLSVSSNLSVNGSAFLLRDCQPTCRPLIGGVFGRLADSAGGRAPVFCQQFHVNCVMQMLNFVFTKTDI